VTHILTTSDSDLYEFVMLVTFLHAEGRGQWAGRFHSQENDDFVGVVDGACLPSLIHDFVCVSGIGAATGGGPYKRMKQPWGNGGDRIYI
jgi:hypothetical protein